MDYQELEVWKKTNDLVNLVYNYADNIPSSELLGLILQIRRAAISIPSNIAVGIVRVLAKEFI
ncbi:four helix bundle protein [Tenuifilum thalassicum]|uniref:Four helix bundle protein n=1 Tax=Tenuifilum thalassicum TaxID=2590900 RepID=A0A7D3XJV5_9BACT|nr:four helix bundle protein [Tenuifilum thalassicum]QKG78915.1 four helix bundle protein [Tenuifilum thalassicum]